MNTSSFKSTFSLVCLSIISVSSFAQNQQGVNVSNKDLKNQKLPDVQEISLRAPANIKMDGKTTEWDNTFQAYNKNTSVFYTMSNDNTNLYLSIQADNASIINKIIRGGVTFTVNTTGRKKAKEVVAVTFPLPGQNNDMRSAFQGMRMGPGMDINAMLKQADSITYAANRQQIDKLKDLKIKGVPAITDSVLSIYNEEGIKARALFDLKGALNYELALPLKYLGLSAENPTEFAYSIKLNGLMAAMSMMVREGGPGGGGAMPAGADRVVISGGGGGMGGGGMMMGGGMSGPLGARMAEMQAMMSPTDFTAKYTLAK